MSDGANPGAPLVPHSPSKEQKSLEEIIREKAPEVLKAIPQKELPKLSQISIERVSVRSGPLPEPSELAAYDQIIPNGADRLMKLVEAQTAHRIEIEKTVVTSQQKMGARGQFFGLIIGLTGLGVSALVGINGQPILGGILGGATLVSLVSVFVIGHQRQKSERADKSRNMAPHPQAAPTLPKSRKGRR